MRRRTILVVDAEPAVRKLWAAVLSDEGYRVIGAADAFDAMQRVAKDYPAVAICNVRLPGPDGAWLAEVMHVKSPKTAIVLVDGAPTAQGVAAVRHAVAQVPKPRDREELLAAVRMAIGWNAEAAPITH